MVSLERQINEAKKCILVCANCHRGIHAGYYKVPDNYESLFDEQQAQYLLEKNQEIKEGKKHYCKSCGKLLNNNSTYCLECGHKVQRVVERPTRRVVERPTRRVVERPTRQELKNLIRNQPFTQIGKKYNISDNAIRKWCIYEKLPTKKSFINSLTDEQWEEI